MTNFQYLVAKVKNLVSLAPVSGAISRPDLYLFIRACLHVGGGPQVGEESQLSEVPRLAVVVYIYT